MVPPLLAHEGAVLDALARQNAPVPNLVAFDGRGRILLDHVPGENQWAPDQDRLVAKVHLLVDLQVKSAGRSALLDLGGPHWRRAEFMTAAAETLASWSAQLPTDAAKTLGRLVQGLDDRFVAIGACGLPATVVHGDFHAGNFRSDGASLVLLYWGDWGYGHALLDMAGFLEQIGAGRCGLIERTWLSAWSAASPGSDPERASDLVGPLAALRRAVVYHRFVEAFEPSERLYHEADVPNWLLAAAALA